LNEDQEDLTTLLEALFEDMCACHAILLQRQEIIGKTRFENMAGMDEDLRAKQFTETIADLEYVISVLAERLGDIIEASPPPPNRTVN
jgi:hypothetical protein